MHNGEDIRLIGVRVDNLISQEELQLSLFSKDLKQEKLDEVLDNIKSKYGYQAITRAREISLDIKLKSHKL